MPRTGSPSSSSHTDSATDRGAATRQALIEAGLDLFGEYGFKGTSTRMLAEAAGANLSAIPYHFGGKQGLYAAVVAYIGERIGEEMGPERDAIGAALAAGELDRAACEAALERLLRRFAHLFVEAEEPRRWVLIMLREQSRPTAAFDSLYENLILPLHGLVSTLIARCAGLPPDSDEATVRTHALLGQVLVFLSSREAIMRRLATEDLASSHAELIYAVLWGHVRACLQVPPLGEDAS